MRKLVLIVDKVTALEEYPVKIQMSELEAKSLFRAPYARIGGPLGKFSGQVVVMGRGGYVEVLLKGESMVNRFAFWIDKLCRDHNTRTFAYYNFRLRDYYSMVTPELLKAHRRLTEQIFASVAVHRKGDVTTKKVYSRLV